MSHAKAGRGRPKGSGLDDRVHLAAIALLLKADPTLKPTTAIKAIGFSDPSSVRRLRDKFRMAREELMGNLRDDKVQTQRPAIPGRSQSAEAAPCSLPLQAQKAPHRSNSAPPRSRAAAVGGREFQAFPLPLPAEAIAWFAAWYGLGLTAVGAMVEAQIAAAGSVLRRPEVAAALRQHVQFNELALAFCRASPDVRKTLH